jgi:hypothetical protein
MTDQHIRFLPFVLYIGPEVMMPVASAIAAAVGFLLMFWRRTVAAVQRAASAVARVFRRTA